MYIYNIIYYIFIERIQYIPIPITWFRLLFFLSRIPNQRTLSAYKAIKKNQEKFAIESK